MIKKMHLVFKKFDKIVNIFCIDMFFVIVIFKEKYQTILLNEPKLN